MPSNINFTSAAQEIKNAVEGFQAQPQYVECCNYKGRLWSLVNAGGHAIGIFAKPIIALVGVAISTVVLLADLALNGCKPSASFIPKKVVEFLALAAVSPLAQAILTARALAGVFFHPAAYYHAAAPLAPVLLQSTGSSISNPGDGDRDLSSEVSEPHVGDIEPRVGDNEAHEGDNEQQPIIEDDESESLTSAVEINNDEIQNPVEVRDQIISSESEESDRLIDIDEANPEELLREVPDFNVIVERIEVSQNPDVAREQIKFSDDEGSGGLTDNDETPHELLKENTPKKDPVPEMVEKIEVSQDVLGFKFDFEANKNYTAPPKKEVFDGEEVFIEADEDDFCEGVDSVKTTLPYEIVEEVVDEVRPPLEPFVYIQEEAERLSTNLLSPKEVKKFCKIVAKVHKGATKPYDKTNFILMRESLAGIAKNWLEDSKELPKFTDEKRAVTIKALIGAATTECMAPLAEEFRIQFSEISEPTLGVLERLAHFRKMFVEGIIQKLVAMHEKFDMHAINDYRLLLEEYIPDVASEYAKADWGTLKNLEGAKDSGRQRAVLECFFNEFSEEALISYMRDCINSDDQGRNNWRQRLLLEVLEYDPRMDEVDKGYIKPYELSIDEEGVKDPWYKACYLEDVAIRKLLEKELTLISNAPMICNTLKK